MPPKAVDKQERRREIAIECFDLIHEVGMKNLTVAQVAKTAGIGKGTVYEYFENKDDIIFEIINIHIEHHHNEFLESIKDIKSTKEKIYHFFKFVLDESEENIRHFNGYKEYLSIVLSDNNCAMKEFNTTCHNFFKDKLNEFIKEGVDNNELIPQAKDLADGLLIFEKGLVLLKMTQEGYDPNEDFKKFINTIFNLVEVKR